MDLELIAKGDLLPLTQTGGSIELDTASRESCSSAHPKFDRYVSAWGRNEIVLRKGRLVAITVKGGEPASGATVLAPQGSGLLQIGEEITPETLRFGDVVDGRALRAI